MLSAIVAGASGYLLKQIRARDLVAALEAVGRGESLLDPAVTEKVLERVRRIASGDVHRRAGAAHPAGAEDPAARRRGQDQQGDRGRGLPLRQDREELRQLDPLEAQPRAPGPGGGVRREAPDRHGAASLKVVPAAPTDRRGRGGRRPHPLGRPGLPPVRRGHALGPARRARGAGAGAARRQRRPPPHARDPGRTSRPRWRRTSATARCSSGRTRGRRSTRVGPTYVPVFLSRRPAAVRARPAARSTRSSSTSRRRTPTASARSGRRSRRCTRRSGPRRRSSRSSTSAMPRTLGDSFIHVDEIDLAVEVDVPPYEHAVGEHRRRRAAHRRVRRRPRAGRRHAPARHRRHPGRRPRWRCATSATSASTPRCSPTRSSTSSRPASSPARARSATGARS